MSMNLERKKRRFSILELIIVLSIFLILVALLLPMLAKSKERAMEVECVSVRQQRFLALIEFAKENDHHFPAATTGNKISYKYSYFNKYKGILNKLGKIAPYLESEEELICPTDISNRPYWSTPLDEPSEFQENHRRWMSYNGTLWSGLTPSTTPKIHTTDQKAIFGDLILRASLLGRDHQRRVKTMAFLDGAVRVLDEETLDMNNLPHWPTNPEYKAFWDNLNEQF